VSRDGFILWSRASDAAAKTGAVFRTSGSPIEIPARSLAASQDQLADGRAGVLHGPGVWFGEEVREMTIFSEQYDFTVTLLLLEDHGPGLAKTGHSTAARDCKARRKRFSVQAIQFPAGAEKPWSA
jgi:hypothetical protein